MTDTPKRAELEERLLKVVLSGQAKGGDWRTRVAGDLYELVEQEIERAVKSAEELTADIEYKAGINYVTMSGDFIPREQHEQEIAEVLLGFASKADAEYTRSEIDNWTFSLGAIVHEAIIEAERNRLTDTNVGKLKED